MFIRALPLLLLVAVSASEESEKSSGPPGLAKIILQKNEGHANLHSLPLSTQIRQRRQTFPEFKKPTHYDVVIPNWNPNVKTKQVIRIKNRNKRSMETLSSQENVYRSPRSLEELASQETVLRSPRSVEELSSQQIEALSSQEVLFRSPRSVENIQDDELRIARSVEELSSQQIEALSSQEVLFRDPRSVEEKPRSILRFR